MAGSESKQWVFNTQTQMNKPIRLMGLSSLQLFAVIGVLGLEIVIGTALLGAPVSIVLFIDLIIAIPIYVLVLKLNKEHKKGQPNYVNSFMSFQQTPKKILDKKNVFKFLINE